MKWMLSLALLAVVGAQAPPALAQQPEVGQPRSAKGAGVIVEIDTKDQTVTLRHEPIPALGWPSMTMPFRVTPPAKLAGLKVGQKVEFETNEGHGLPEITAIRPAG